MSSTEVNTVDSSSIFKKKNKKRTFPRVSPQRKKMKEWQIQPISFSRMKTSFLSSIGGNKKGIIFFRFPIPPPPTGGFPYSLKRNFFTMFSTKE
jgi:hypothetical protein